MLYNMIYRGFYFLVPAAFLLAFSAANAADLKPVYKARQFSYIGCHAYGGIHTVAENQKLGVEGQRGLLAGGLSGLGGTFAVGAAIGATVGYHCGDGTTFKQAELMGSWKNIGQGVPVIDPATGVAIPASVTSKYEFTERFKLGGPWGEVLAMFPTIGGALPTSPILPAGAVDAHLYLFGAAHQENIQATFADASSGTKWRNRFGFGTGTMFRPSPASKIVMDVWFEYIPTQDGFSFGSPTGTQASANNGKEIRIGLGGYF